MGGGGSGCRGPAFPGGSGSGAGVRAPCTQSFLNYVLLAAAYGPALLRRGARLEFPWFYYAGLAVVDVEANYLGAALLLKELDHYRSAVPLLVKAYQYTSLTSVALLDCWAIPCVLLLTWLLLGTRHSWAQFAGVAVCIAGLLLVLLSDSHVEDRTGGQHPLLGDLLVLLGATLYATANVGEEFLVKNADIYQLLGMSGCFGASISLVQLLVLERSELLHTSWSPDAIAPFAVYAAALFLFYTLVPLMLKISGATLLNLSLLTADIWAVAVRSWGFHEKVDWIYFVAFATVAVGLFVYSAE
eukprot:SM000053S17430  [mRNA]  locus=s53:290114:294449:+ [translate_table: standard]